MTVAWEDEPLPGMAHLAKSKGAGLVRGDALSLPFADGSVDLIVTSPPYFALRSYQDNGGHYGGQIGSEPTPRAFLEALWAVTAECARVLKPSGSMFVNLGDKMAGSGGHNNAGLGTGNLGDDRMRSSTLSGGKKRALEAHKGGDRANAVQAARRSAPNRYNQASDGVRRKSLMLLPEAYRLGCTGMLQALGGPPPPGGVPLIVRAVIVWCLSGGAKVYARTPTGDRPIMLRDLVRHHQPEDVHLWNGQKWTQVLGWNRSADTDGALELELRSGERIGCTVGHQWPTNRGLLRADQIQVGDVIDTCRLPEPDEPRNPAYLPDEDIGWLVGLYIAEGSRSETTVQIAGHIKEVARNDRLARIAAALDATCNVYQTDENAQTCNLRGSALVGVINRYVSPGTAKTKRLNLPVWQRSDRFLAAVMEGYLEGDGHYDAKNDRWRLGFTENDEWASDVRTLAARLGVSLTLKRSATTAFADSSGPRVFPGWRGEWRWTTSQHWNTKPRGEVVAVRLSRARQFFDVGVADEPHTFALASGVLTHNSKPNGLPESVTDRVRRSHEDWVHLTKEPTYFANVDEVREATGDYKGNTWSDRKKAGGDINPGGHSRGLSAGKSDQATVFAANPLGKLPGSVWTVPTEPLVVPDWLGVDHFAAFPQEWPRRLILGWSPPGICVACGEGRRADTTAEHEHINATSNAKSNAGEALHSANRRQPPGSVSRKVVTITGEACACPDTTAPTRPAVVLDPFSGTGTTCLVARSLGRFGVGVDLSADYLRLANWRVFESGAGAKTVSRTWKERQGGLFGGDAA